MDRIAKRKRVTYYLDERVIRAISAMAGLESSSANRWLEGLCTDSAVVMGALPPDFEPLGELRGGLRKSTEDDFQERDRP